MKILIFLAIFFYFFKYGFLKFICKNIVLQHIQLKSDRIEKRINIVQLLIFIEKIMINSSFHSTEKETSVYNFLDDFKYLNTHFTK